MPGCPSWKSAEIGLFLPFSAFFGGCEGHLENPENGGKMPFSSDISDCLNPHLLSPHLRHSKKQRNCRKIAAFSNHKVQLLSSGASGGSLHGGANSEVEKAHLAA